MNRLLHAVDGAYALGIICADYPDRLVAARKDAPLLLGFGDGENFIASDVTALIRHTRDIAYMDDGELAILSRSGIRVYDRQLRPVEKKHHHVDWEVDAAEKGGYAHFMLKEIMEQPEAIRKATAAPDPGRPRGASGPDHDPGADPGHRPHLHRGLRLRRTMWAWWASITWSGCCAAAGGGVPGLRVPLLRPHRRREHDLVIVISQSGETLDTMAALREAKQPGRPAFCPSSTWWAPPSPGSPTTCCIPGPGRRSPWPPPRPTPPRWRCWTCWACTLADVLGTVDLRGHTPP